MSVLTSGRNVLLEKYLSDTSSRKDFKIIETELAKLIQIIKENYPPLYKGLADSKSKPITEAPKMNVRDITNSDHTRLIEKQFMKIFNLKGFELVWTKMQGPNAITPNRTFSFIDFDEDVKKIKNHMGNFKVGQGTLASTPTFNGKKSKEGYSNPNLFIGTIVDVGLVSYCDLNEQELLAIILHEIGHNFYTSILHVLSRLPISISTIGPELPQMIVSSLVQYGLYDIIGFHEIFTKVSEKIQDVLYKYAPGIMNLYNLGLDVMYNITALFGINDLAFFVKYLPFYMGTIFSTKYFFGYSEEKFADNFAVRHGYGPALASAMNKLDQQKENLIIKATSEVPGINWVVDFMRLQTDIVSLCVAAHPRSQDRIRSGLDTLKREAKDPDLSPEVRRHLETQIKQYENWYYKEYLNFSKNDNKLRIFSWLYRVGCEKLFAGKLDIRELIYRLDDLQF